MLLDNAYHAKIADFGLSKLKVKTSTTTQNDKALGTVRWMAPELFERRAKHTPASDVYSYGMVMWANFVHFIPLIAKSTALRQHFHKRL